MVNGNYVLVQPVTHQRNCIGLIFAILKFYIFKKLYGIKSGVAKQALRYRHFANVRGLKTDSENCPVLQPLLLYLSSAFRITGSLGYLNSKVFGVGNFDARNWLNTNKRKTVFSHMKVAAF